MATYQDRFQALTNAGLSGQTASLLLEELGALQEDIDDAGLGGGLTNPLTETLDADNHRISNVGDPEAEGDAISAGVATALIDDAFGQHQAAAVGNVSDPATATAEDVANMLNELLVNMRDSGLLAGIT